MDDLRPAELAGSWYPETREGCEAFLESIEPPLGSDLSVAHGAIVPHAGWRYSGRVAFEALLALHQRAPGADLVAVLGGHLQARDKPRVFLGGRWDTPYGPLEVDGGLSEDIAMGLESEAETPEEYYDDNAVEVLMPMIKKLWPSQKIIVLGIPPVAGATGIGVEVLDLAERRGYERPIFIGSTDLTHYGPNYRYAPAGGGHRALDWVKTKNDPMIVEKMCDLLASRVVWTAERQKNACCPGAAAAAIAASKKAGATAGSVTRYTTSWDVHPTTPEPASFVGYVGMVLGASAG